jgi:leader peptidase (prepilin peptidase) / N-methyltransferase
LSDELFARGAEVGIVPTAAQRIRKALSRAPGGVWGGAAWSAAGLCAVAASVLAAPGLSGALGGALAVVMIAIAAIDARRFVIPDRLVLAALALGLVEASIAEPERFAAGLAGAVLRGLALALAFLGFRAAYRRLRGREGLGLGDVKLAAVAGIWLSWLAVAFAVDIAALSALAVVLMRAVRGARITAKTKIAFGLFFAPAIWCAWLFQAMNLRLPI